MNSRRVIIVGGGAAGFFAAIACAEASPDTEVIVLERGPEFLTKVRISGGGRCNVTHACFDVREMTARYPRGEKALIAPFQRFQASDTVEWFEKRGVKLKTESDGRMFPVTDSSQTIVDCLMHHARRSGVKLFANCGVDLVQRKATDVGFCVTLTGTKPGETFNIQHSTSNSQPGSHSHALDVERSMLNVECSRKLHCDQLLLATGGCRAAAASQLAVSLGHTLQAPVPSLFTFRIETSWLRQLAGVAVQNAEVSVSETKLRERGAVLLTHWGLSGPAILRLSAWGARALHGLNYHFTLHVNWLPELNAESLALKLQALRNSQPAKLIVNTPLAPLPSRLWEQLVLASGIARETRWSVLSRAAQHALIQQLLRTELQVTGKSLNKDEFVTCGGVPLAEVNFKTMESKLCPGLHFAGELLDIDGITGGFNFQAAWTTGWIAGRAMAALE